MTIEFKNVVLIWVLLHFWFSIDWYNWFWKIDDVISSPSGKKLFWHPQFLKSWEGCERESKIKFLLSRLCTQRYITPCTKTWSNKKSKVEYCSDNWFWPRLFKISDILIKANIAVCLCFAKQTIFWYFTKSKHPKSLWT